ncbi:hypothetical protein PHYSODRAFT_332206 [Phytophthora sojae]|uniref:Uncharacterized protein n=1 Tax=Phytophthora sojae (strain P6497) TaxID=1094619 RepID=G4ZED8_PHYSP|nr:hypothetical protein PHYSODRAFT_332206 [Phytophthora sojae]EGZ18403.1 hypothetical protein PHYSODRAFT_332206 [Phytophthora sojae]|eukprot:XP_009527461.1 hypothetical protein PHYSODRAFT_332206 [Phytophthora sojae]
MKGNTDTVQLLLNHNPDVNKHNISWKTALDYTESHEDPMIATLLCGAEQSRQPTHNVALQTDEVQGSEIATLFGEYEYKGSLVKDAGTETEEAAEKNYSIDDVSSVQTQSTVVEEYHSGSGSGSDSDRESSYSAGEETVSLEEESVADSESDGGRDEESSESEAESESSS